MFIARNPQKEPFKPRRGGTAKDDGICAAPPRPGMTDNGSCCYKHAAPLELGGEHFESRSVVRPLRVRGPDMPAFCFSSRHP